MSRASSVEEIRERLARDYALVSKGDAEQAHADIAYLLEIAEAAREFHDSLVAPVAMHERERAALRRLRDALEGECE